MVTPLFPALTISYIESHWFSGDEPIDEDAVLTAMEKESNNLYNELPQKFGDYLPPTSSSDHYEVDEEEEEEDNDDDDEGSGSNDDDNEEELEVDDIGFNPDSPIINMS